MDLGGVGGLGAGELRVADDLGRRPVIGRGGCLATADLAFLDGVSSKVRALALSVLVRFSSK